MDETAGAKTAAAPPAAPSKVKVRVRCPTRPNPAGGAWPGYWCAGTFFPTGESVAEVEADRLQELKDDPTVVLMAVGEEVDQPSSAKAAPASAPAPAITSGFVSAGPPKPVESTEEAPHPGPGKPPKSSSK